MAPAPCGAGFAKVWFARGSRGPARRGNAFRGRHRRCGARGVEVVRSHRRDIDALRAVAVLLSELSAPCGAQV